MANAISYTSVYNFPYPLGTDDISSGAARLEALARRMEEVLVDAGIEIGTYDVLKTSTVFAGAIQGTYNALTLNTSVPLPNGMTATTQAQSDNSTKVATTAYVDAYVTGTVPDGSIGTAELADGAVTNVKVNAAAAISYSKLNLASSITSADIVDNTIVNADINASAAISYSKLSLTGSIVNADVATSAAIAYSKLNLATSIVNADIATGAAIVDTKLATISTAGKVSNTATTATDANTASAIVARDASGNFTAGTITANITGNVSGSSGSTTGNAATVTTNANLTGDVTSVGNATSIASGVIVNADVNASAAISYSKLSLGTSIVNADISTSAAIAYSKLALTGAIVNADLAGSIDPAKITGTAVITSDARLSDARTPTAHASTHASAGSDPITISPSQVTGTAVVTGDSRLSDSRTPTSHAGTHVPGGSDVLDYSKIIGYGTSLPTWNATTHPNGVLWVVNTVGEPYSLYRSDGTSAWKQVGGGGASVTASDTAPSSPTSGALWFDSTTGKTFIWYVDGSSNQWVEVGEASQLAIATHGSSHVRGGSDIIDGDRLTVDYVPTNYTRNAAASGAGDVTDLAANLSGIDNQLRYGMLTFTTEAARDAAITSPVEGMMAYITAPTIPTGTGNGTAIIPSGIQTIYNGSVWVCVTPIAILSTNNHSVTASSPTNFLNAGTPLTVTCVTGTTAIVHIKGRGVFSAGAYIFVGLKTATVNPADGLTLQYLATSAAGPLNGSYFLTGLTAGTNTFTLQGWTHNGTAINMDAISIVVQGVA